MPHSYLHVTTQLEELNQAIWADIQFSSFKFLPILTQLARAASHSSDLFTKINREAAPVKKILTVYVSSNLQIRRNSGNRETPWRRGIPVWVLRCGGVVHHMTDPTTTEVAASPSHWMQIKCTNISLSQTALRMNVQNHRWLFIGILKVKISQLCFVYAAKCFQQQQSKTKY